MANKALTENLRKAYNAFDTNKDGTLTVEELNELIRKVAAGISDHDIETLVHKLDKNGDNKIDFEEFLKEMSNTHYYSKSEIEETFRFFDKDGSGFIDDNELYEAMKKLKNNITRDQVSTIMAKIDTDDSGKVSMAEFVKLMS